MIRTLQRVGYFLLVLSVALLVVARLLPGSLLSDSLTFASMALVPLGALCQVPAGIRHLWVGPAPPPRPRQQALALLTIPGPWRYARPYLVIWWSLVLLLGLQTLSLEWLPLAALAALLGLAPLLVYQWLSPGQHLQRRLLAGQLAAMLEVGIPLPEALEQLQEQAQRQFSTRFQAYPTVLAWLAFDLRSGSLFSTALANHSFFPKIWPAMVRLGERSGRLPRLLRGLSQIEASRPKRLHLLIPLLVLPFILLLTYLLQSVTAAQYALFTNMGHTQRNWLSLMPALLGALGVAIVVSGLTVTLPLLGSRRRALLWVSDGLQRLPLLWPLVQLEQQLLCLRAMAVGAEVEHPSTELVALARDGCTHRQYYLCLDPDRVAAGSTLAQTLGAHPDLFLEEVVGLVEYGEKNGQLTDSLGFACSYLEDRLHDQEAMTEQRVSLLLQLLTGLVVAGNALMFLVPIMDMYVDLFAAANLP